MNRKIIWALICALLALLSLSIVLFFNQYVMWEDLPKNTKKYFYIFGFGTAASWAAIAGALIVVRYLQKRRQQQREQMLTRARV